ncbi:hypothetical protein [Streptomyces sp. NPDC058255]
MPRSARPLGEQRWPLRAARLWVLGAMLFVISGVAVFRTATRGKRVTA